MFHDKEAALRFQLHSTRIPMNACVVRRLGLAGTLLGAVVLLGACEDKRVKALQTGITRDSVMSVTASGTQRTDSMPSIYKRAEYLINGKMLEVLYFDSDDRKAGTDSIPLRKLTPLVMFDGKLVGKGWAAWDSAASANHISIPKY
jgi:hypothetical protein